jgi:hypothetical protein
MIAGYQLINLTSEKKKMKKALIGAVVSSCALLLSQGAIAASSGPNVVNVTAKEYSYDMPKSIPAGPTLFHFTDAGNQLHHLTLIKLGAGKTVKDFVSLPPGPMPSWATFVGGPNVPVPHGGTSDDAIDLAPGNYAAVCLVPGPDGKPHMMDGMAQGLKVVPSSHKGHMPKSDVTLTLNDYMFTFSRPLTAGKHIVKVVNHAKQPHEATLFKMAPGKKGEDMANWVTTGMKGPPPGAPATGISPESPGEKNFLYLNLTAGNYALLCFVPDAKDGKPHVMHGMIYNFKI